MKISTMTIIVTLVIGGFLIFQDNYEISPRGVFSFSPLFYIGIALIIGAMVVFGILSFRRKRAKASTSET